MRVISGPLPICAPDLTASAMNDTENPIALRKNWILRAVLLTLGLGAYFLLTGMWLTKTGIGCVFLYLFGIPCPGCGMTRALRSLLRLDLVSAFRFHPLVFAMPYVLGYIIFPMDGRRHRVILAVIGVLAFLIWVLRICCVTI